MNLKREIIPFAIFWFKLKKLRFSPIPTKKNCHNVLYVRIKLLIHVLINLSAMYYFFQTVSCKIHFKYFIDFN